MSYLIRKIGQAKWKKQEVLKGNPVPADAITSCLRTSSNTLSTWEIDTLDSLNSAILAISTNVDYLETMDFVAIPKQNVIDSGLDIEQTEGKTGYESMKNTHRDISFLNYDKLGIVANLVIEQFKADNVYRKTKRTIINLVMESIDNGELSPSDFTEKAQEILSAEFQKREPSNKTQ